MALKKITDAEMDASGVCAAPDVLSGTPAQNKAVFDRMVRQLVAPAYNAAVDAIDEIEETESGIETAEAGRAAAEAQRQENEEARQSAETARGVSEEQRQQDEATRQAAETARDTAEEARQENEEARQAAALHTPRVGTDGCWEVWDFAEDKYVSTGYPAIGSPAAFDVGEDGSLRLYYTGDTAPDYSVNEDGHLLLQLDEDTYVDLGLVRGPAGKDGANGITPSIGDNGNWYLGDEDTGGPSRGVAGPQGPQGAAGPQGPQGDPGITTMTQAGYTAAVAAGTIDANTWYGVYEKG